MDEIAKKQMIQRQQKYQSFLRSMNCCPLCSTPLTLIHEIYEEEDLIKETAHCDQCEIETRRKDHARH